MAGGESWGRGLIMTAVGYRGRIAPSPTGYLHLGHARTFWTAHQRARRSGGQIVYRTDDLDGPRCRSEYSDAALEDLRWLGLDWDEGPDCGGPCAPYEQSERYAGYREALLSLVRNGLAYPCYCSRKDIQKAASAPHEGEDELIYPGTCRPRECTSTAVDDWMDFVNRFDVERHGRRPSWRFRVPEDFDVEFTDARMGRQSFRGGKAFGDFVAWRRDGVCSYQLACVVDDAAMGITEVVRGADLLVSTARQILLRKTLQLPDTAWCHCDLMRDEEGERLAKRTAALSLRELREQGADPVAWHAEWERQSADLLIPGPSA